MGLLSLVEDRPTPKAVYNWRVYACAAVASFASCLIGYDSAFIGTTLALPSFEKEFGFDKMSDSKLAFTKSNIVSIYQAGAFWGALFAYTSAYFLGRKRSLMMWSVLFLLGAGLTLGPNSQRGLGLMYAGRVITGVGVGALSMTTPIYISEIAPPAVRGRLVGIYELGWQIGGLVGFWINYGINKHLPPSSTQWLIPFAIQLIPGGLLGLGAIWLRESPRWLISKGRRELATKNLCWIRNLPADDLYIVEEISFLDAALEEQRSTIGDGFFAPFKAVISSRTVMWRFVLGGSLFMFQNGSGINAINYYSPTVFKSLGVAGTNASFLTTGLFGVVKTCLTLIWLFFLIDNLGRRNLLLFGAAGGSICMWIIGAYLAAHDPTTNKTDSVQGGGIAAIFFIYLWTAFYTPSWNGTPWVLNSEMFDQNCRQLGQAWASANNWFWNFIISRFTPDMFLSMGRSGFGVYMFFASMMILSIVWVFFLVPETKGIPLEQMDRLFEITPKRRAHAIALAEYREHETQFRRESLGEIVISKEKEAGHIEETSRHSSA